MNDKTQHTAETTACAAPELTVKLGGHFPRANGGGWTISPRLLQRIADETTEVDLAFSSQMEEVEVVLLALERISARDANESAPNC